MNRLKIGDLVRASGDINELYSGKRQCGLIIEISKELRIFPYKVMWTDFIAYQYSEDEIFLVSRNND